MPSSFEGVRICKVRPQCSVPTACVQVVRAAMYLRHQRVCDYTPLRFRRQLLNTVPVGFASRPARYVDFIPKSSITKCSTAVTYLHGQRIHQKQRECNEAIPSSLGGPSCAGPRSSRKVYRAADPAVYNLHSIPTKGLFIVTTGGRPVSYTHLTLPTILRV